jgi:hypothetical protein
MRPDASFQEPHLTTADSRVRALVQQYASSFQTWSTLTEQELIFNDQAS